MEAARAWAERRLPGRAAGGFLPEGGDFSGESQSESESEEESESDLRPPFPNFRRLRDEGLDDAATAPLFFLLGRDMLRMVRSSNALVFEVFLDTQFGCDGRTTSETSPTEGRGLLVAIKTMVERNEPQERSRT